MNDTLELTAPNRTEVAVVAPVNVDQLDTAKPLAEIFQPYQTTLEKWEAKAKSLIVTDISMKTEMAQARLARLELKDARVEMDKTRKGLVENLNLRTGKINGTAKIIRDKLESLEALLLESEQFAERYAAKVKSELKAKREADLVPLLDAPLLGDLSDLSEADFLKTLNNAVMLRQAKIDAAAKVKADREAKEESDRLERERIAAENAKLKLEAEATAKRLEVERKEREAQAAKERAEQEAERKRVESERQAEREKAESERKAIEAKAKAEAAEVARVAEAERQRIESERAAERAKAKKERDAIEAAAAETARKAREESDRLNAELAAKAKAEAAEKARVESERKAQGKAARAAAAAPDKIKLNAFAGEVRELTVPSLTNEAVQMQVIEKLESFARWIESQIAAELL